ncbi:MAG TPA: DUF1801 domain-containing protein [Ferruginibacter sp.]|nr:hypothetical protein [Chitinophagaceae bacterium]HRI25298.1 DUF1801 domain-containing protein [Ferruginibacter sp.]
MIADKRFDDFMGTYDEPVFRTALQLRTLLLAKLPEIIEQVDMPAKMVAYCYGQKYTEMICMMIPSKKGLKLSFYKGVDLDDPDALLQGKGKITRYLEIKPGLPLNKPVIEKFLAKAWKLYRQRMKK